MANELFDAFKNNDVVDSDNIVSLKKGFNKKTGTQYVKATTITGETFVKEYTSSGVEIRQRVDVPTYKSKERRNELINDLYHNKKYTQEDIASMVGVSQSTVHNVLKK